jgi:hypothetical protein
MTKTTSKKLKLYVWEGILCDYTCGIAFALAESVEEARKLVIESEYEVNRTHVEEDIKGEPKIFDTPKGYVLWGGS